MLVNLTEILKMAEEKKYAIGAFNTPNLECLNAVTAAAEELNVPVTVMLNTDSDQAEAFCRETGIDALAPSFGTAHGICRFKPMSDQDRVKVIQKKRRTNAPFFIKRYVFYARKLDFEATLTIRIHLS